MGGGGDREGWQPGQGAPCRDAGEQGGGVLGSQGAAGGRARGRRLGTPGKGTVPPSVDRLRSVIRRVGGGAEKVQMKPSAEQLGLVMITMLNIISNTRKTLK